MHGPPPKTEGLRERKRRQTFQRIADGGLELFLAKGYTATTIDEIAAMAGISRRTFFHYFKSKDDILLAHLGGYADTLRVVVAEHSAAGAPIDVAREALLKFSATTPPARAMAIARVMGESEALRAREAVSYQQLEKSLYAGLCEIWPKEARHDCLRLVAMVSIGAMRLAVDKWLQHDSEQSLATHIQNAFMALKAEIG